MVRSKQQTEETNLIICCRQIISRSFFVKIVRLPSARHFSNTNWNYITRETFSMIFLIWSLSKSKKGFGFNLFRSFLARDSFPQLMSLVKKNRRERVVVVNVAKILSKDFFQFASDNMTLETQIIGSSHVVNVLTSPS